MKRLAAAILVLVAAFFGLIVGALAWDSFRGPPEVVVDGASSGWFATESFGRDWLWAGVPAAVLFGGVALYLARGRFVQPS